MSDGPDRLNAIPEFVELRARLVKDDEKDDHRFIRVDVRVQPTDIEDEDGHVIAKVSLTRAVLSLDINGLDVVSGTRLGEPIKGAGLKIKTELKETTTSTAKIEGGAQLGITATGQPDASIKAGTSGAREKVISHTRQVDLEQQHIFVKARGNDTWEITEADGSKLDGTYLNDDALCQFILRKGANRAGVSTSIEIKQKDLEFDFTKGNFGFLSNNKKKLLGILLAKSIGGNQESYKGKIIMSKSESEDD